MLSAICRFVFILLLVVLDRLLFRYDVTWVGANPQKPFTGMRLFVFLNHTSLFDPILFSAIFPLAGVWDAAKRGIAPIADITFNRKIGFIFKSFVSTSKSLSRKRDETWRRFLDSVGPRSIVYIAAEGRMMRRSGLDKDGNPLTVRGGVADVLIKLGSGRMIVAYSGGVHHVFAPGDKFPRFFKTLKIRCELLEIADYIREIDRTRTTESFRAAVIRDLERRKTIHCPRSHDTRLPIGLGC